ncbi:gliding motility lipoprotein GldH [Rurimicrobium arvi]|uniref:Gliding motility lipoprotein GldH n=1 Tax=Rurimicrobium arvi TaxID=2049916 RepID=A0ABP8MXF2_9BACT
MKILSRVASFLLLLPLFLIGGCVQSPYFQKTYDIPGNKWKLDYHPSFVLDIEDTTIHYNISFLIRHTNNYPYSNIWLKLGIKGPGDTTFTNTRVEVPLATPQGQWLGTGMGEIYEQRRMIVVDHNAIPVTLDLVSLSENSYNNLFSKKGRYEIRLEHNMRDNMLPDVLQVGLRIEKSSKRSNDVKQPAVKLPGTDTSATSVRPPVS